MVRFALRALAAISVLGLGFVTIRHLTEPPPAPPRPYTLALVAPPGTQFGAGDELLDAAISPDQREIVFVATRITKNSPGQPAPGVSQLWRQTLADGRAAPVPGTEGARLPAWQQAGSVLAFFSDERLQLVNLRTGETSSAADAPAPGGATWLRDGSLLFVPRSGPVRRLLQGRTTDATALASGDVAHTYPLAVGATNAFTYIAVREDGRRVIRLHEDGIEHDLGTSSTHAALLESGLVLHVESGTVIANHRDPDEQRRWGRDVPVALNVDAAGGRGAFLASDDLLLHAPAAERRQRVVWLDMQGTETGATGDAGDYWQLRLSADDRSLAVTARDTLLQSLDIIRMPATGSAPLLRLTRALAADSDPVWSDEGTRLLFRSMQRGRPELFVTQAIAGAADATPESMPLGMHGDVPTDWRGREMLLQVQSNGHFDLVRVADGGQSAPVATSPFNETGGRWSPDGRWIAYVSDEFGGPDIYVQDSEGMRQRISTAGGTHPRWTRDGRALLFLRGSQVMRADLDRESSRFGHPRPSFIIPGIRDFDVARRSDRIVAILPAPSSTADTISVVVNWQSLFR